MDHPQHNLVIASANGYLVSSVLAASMGLALVLIAFVSFDIWEGHEHALADANRNTENIARLVAASAEEGIAAIDRNLATTEAVFRRFPTGRPAQGWEIDWLLKGRLKLLPHTGALVVTDDQGVVAHVAGEGAPSPASSVASQDYFLWHRDNPASTVRVGKPIKADNGGRWLIPISRRLTAPDGNFGGVIAALCDPLLMQRFSGSVHIGKNEVNGIYLQDGTLLAREPHLENLLGQSFSQHPIFSLLLANAPQGTFRGASIVDGKPRIFNYTTIPGLRLVVVAGLAETDVFANWRRHAIIEIVAVGSLIIALGILTGILIRQLRGQHSLIAQLASGKARYEQLIDTASEGIWQINAAHRTTFVNLRALGMLGHSEHELMGRNMEEFVLQEDQPVLRRMLQQQRDEGTPAQFDLRFTTRDGAVLWTITSISSFKDEGEAGPSTLAMLTDITSRAEAESKVRKNLLRLQTMNVLGRGILAANPCSAIAATALHHLLQLVPCWGATIMTLDFEADTLTVLSMLRPDGSQYDPGIRLSCAEYGRMDLARLYTGEACTVTDMDLLTNPPAVLRGLYEKGMRSYVRVPILVEGSLIGVVNLGNDRKGAFSKDQVEIVRSIADVLAIALRQTMLRERLAQQSDDLEARVKERTSTLESLNRELESFAMSVTHDLRAPLRHIDGFASMLLQSPNMDPNSTSLLRRISDSARRMNLLINALLALARSTSSQLQRENVDMNELVKEVVDELSLASQSRQIDWHIENLPNANADLALMRVVLQNLLGNAVKYTSAIQNARIEITTRQDEDGTTLWCIRDNGAGFDMAQAGRLFNAFSRLHTEREFEGTGVGLATVKRIITRHGGRVEAFGTPGKGAEFRFTLGAGSEV